MEDALSPKETNSLFTPTGYGLGEVNDVVHLPLLDLVSNWFHGKPWLMLWPPVWKP